MNRPLTGMTVEEMATLLGSRTRALSLARWLFSEGNPPSASPLPDSIPGVSRRIWTAVRESCELRLPRVAAHRASDDGTIKLALEAEGAHFETVVIPAQGRSTVCISSQAGCSRRCRFCATGRLGLTRNLQAHEMVEQLLIARVQAPARAPLRNVVLMGMGEPMDNLDAVLQAVRIWTQAPAPQLGADHVTVSTSGVLPGMRRFLEECQAHLALSLNGTTDAQRSRLMPQNEQWPISELLDALRQSARQDAKRIFFIEYVPIEGINDSEADACRLLELLRGIPARVNLIAHNPFPGCELRPAPAERMLRFQRIVNDGGIRCMLRASRGREISAACGQLAGRI